MSPTDLMSPTYRISPTDIMSSTDRISSTDVMSATDISVRNGDHQSISNQ